MSFNRAHTIYNNNNIINTEIVKLTELSVINGCPKNLLNKIIDNIIN